MTELWQLSAWDARRGLLDRKFSAVELTRSCLERAQAVEGMIHAFITQTPELALAEAQDADVRLGRGEAGWMCGIPYAVKDNYFTAQAPTTAGSRVPLPPPPVAEATIVSRLRASGAILTGKLNTWEFGTGTGQILPDLPYPIARNPWDPRRFTGGSSSGSGAVVPSGGALISFGSDTGGSIRFPAAACGLVGLKPTYGRVPRAGILPNCYSLDVAGPLGWRAHDCALAMNVIAGWDHHDPACAREAVPDYIIGLDRSVRGLKVGVLDGCFENEIQVDDVLMEGLRNAVEIFRALGMETYPVRPEYDRCVFRDCMRLINSVESASIHRSSFIKHHDKMGQALKDKLLGGEQISGVDYVNAVRWRRGLAESVTRLLDKVDVIVTFGTNIIPPLLSDDDAIKRFTTESNMTMCSISGHPAISFCVGKTSDGIPLNAQLVGKYFNEHMLLHIVSIYERETGFLKNKPHIGEI